MEAIRPVLLQWVGRKHGHISFHLTQLLTGHGTFAAFFHRIGKETTDECRHCGLERDTAQHTLRACPAWGGGVQRATLIGVVGPDLSLPHLITEMLESKDKWRAASKFALEVLTLKIEAERKRERQARAPSPP